MVEQSNTCESHCDAILVASLNNIIVTDRTAGLSDEINAALSSTLYIVTEWEECVRAKGYTLNGLQPSCLFLTGKRCWLLGKETLPSIGF